MIPQKSKNLKNQTSCCHPEYCLQTRSTGLLPPGPFPFSGPHLPPARSAVQARGQRGRFTLLWPEPHCGSKALSGTPDCSNKLKTGGRATEDHTGVTVLWISITLQYAIHSCKPHGRGPRTACPSSLKHWFLKNSLFAAHPHDTLPEQHGPL